MDTNTTAKAPKLTATQRDYLARFVEGPGYGVPFGVNANVARNALRKGLVQALAGGTVELTDLGRAALAA